jgi:hypothetical protein
MLASAAVLGGCAAMGSDVELVDGPPITDITTRFDEALYCLQGRVNSSLTFAVGGIPDQTGREQNSVEGAGRFVTQGAGDIVQSALFNAGVTVINRRDMGSAAMEAQWGIRDFSTQVQANLVITGSINSLDFIPGGGAFVAVGGVGPRYRQNRILVGMDLAMTNNNTGQIVGNIALRKQIVADELGFMFARITNDQIVDVDFGGNRREAVHFVLREMLQLATFELLTQLMPPERYEDCRLIIDDTLALIEGERTTGGQMRQLEERRAAAEAALAAAETPPAPAGTPATAVAEAPQQPQAPAQPQTAPAAAVASGPTQPVARPSRPEDPQETASVEAADPATAPVAEQDTASASSEVIEGGDATAPEAVAAARVPEATVAEQPGEEVAQPVDVAVMESVPSSQPPGMPEDVDADTIEFLLRTNPAAGAHILAFVEQMRGELEPTE